MMTTMRRWAIRDEDGSVIASGCSPKPPTEGDVGAVRAFAALLATQPIDPEIEARQEEARRRTHERLRRRGLLRCQVCSQPSGDLDECASCAADEEAAAKRRVDV